LIKVVKPIFEIVPDDGKGQVPVKNGLEGKFMSWCDILVTVGINEKNKDSVDMIKLQLIHICKTYSISFAKLLEVADKMQQPNRLMFLRTVWEKAVR